MNVDTTADILLPEPKAIAAFEKGIVKSVNSDGSYEVKLNKSNVAAHCEPGCTAGVGDRVLVCIMANGRCVAVSRLEGDYAEFAKPAKFTYAGKQSLLVEHGAEDECMFYTRRSDIDLRIGFGIGSSGTNRGIYDYALGRWMILNDGSAHSKIPKLHITGTTDLSGVEDREVPLIIGNREGTHLVIDGNEIQRKASGTTTSTLALNPDGGNVSINGSTVIDFVTAYGTSGSWYYRKWKSGRAECWRSFSFSKIATTNAYGTLYYYQSSEYSFPFEMPSVTAINITAYSGTGLLHGSVYYLTTTKFAFWISNSMSQSPTTVQVMVYVCGTWK